LRRKDNDINELVTRKNRYTRNKKNKEKKSNNENNTVEELITRNGRYTREITSKDKNSNNQSPNKESSVDCILNVKQSDFTVDKLYALEANQSYLPQCNHPM
jgi:hypothetical protein